MRVAERVRDALGMYPIAELQWSRNLRVAESGLQWQVHYDFNKLQWSRNLRVAERTGTSRPPRAAPRFNGAAT